MNKLTSYGLHSTFQNSPYDKMSKIAESLFGTIIDPTQIPITKESRVKFNMLSQHSLLTALDKNDNPISWVLCIPTTIELMDKFILGEITEKELFDRTEPAESYSALYLCSAITIPEYRQKGIAKALLIESIEKFKETNPNIQLFAWIYSPEGKMLSNSLLYEVKLKQ